MASASFSLNAVVQDVFQATEPAPHAATNVTSANANQAQGAPAPADTVTLTNQTAEGQQTRADLTRGHFDRAAFLGAAGAYIGTNAARPDRQTPESTLPLLLPQTQTQVAPAATATTAANIAANTATNTGNTANAAANTASAAAAGAPDAGSSANANAPQQELQMLDETLQQLGISPQSIPLFSRMAMLLYASDPAALRLFVQTLQGAAQTANAAGNANQAAVQSLLPAATPADQGQGTAQPPATAPSAAEAPTQSTNSPQGQAGQGTEQIDLIAAQINFTEVQATVEPAQASVAQASSGAPANVSASTPAAQSSALMVQLEELQVAFQAVDIQPNSQQLNGSSDPAPTGTSLNVTA